jgi:NitT/TauT family transport system ATP-binding protein
VITHAIEEAVVLGKRILLLDAAPTCTPKIFENPSAGMEDHRESKEYQELCNLLRREMQHETA